MGPKSRRSASKFITRTIVIAPPPAAAPAEQRRPPREPSRRARACTSTSARRAAHRPPDAAPEPDRVDLRHAPAPDPFAQNADATLAQAARRPGNAAAAPRAGERQRRCCSAAKAMPQPTMPGSVPLRMPGSVRLIFAATAQQRRDSRCRGVFGELVWLQDGEHYDARLSLKFLFFDDPQLAQHRRDRADGHRAGALRRQAPQAEVASHFVRDQEQIVFSNNAPSVTLLAGRAGPAERAHATRRPARRRSCALSARHQ